ncbi:MAG: PLP-dependent aminotransferase family protein [Promethearchaeota archaeon]
MYNFAKWTEKIPELEIGGFSPYSPKFSFTAGRPGVLAIKTLGEILGNISEELSAETQKNGEFSSNWLFDYGPTEGLPEFRQILAARLRNNDNVTLDSNDGWKNVIITSGLQQTIYALLDVLTNPGDLVIVTRPTYVGFLGPATKLGVELISVPSDEEGMIPEAVEKACELCRRHLRQIPKMLYVIPYFDNPQGTTLSSRRKQSLYDIAVEWDLLIAEDMAYKEIRFNRSVDLHPIKELDKDNSRVAYLSTTSKETGSLRLGYSVIPTPIQEQIVKLKGYFDLCSPSLNQTIAKIFYEKHIDNVLPKVVTHYQKRAETMKKAIDASFPEGTRTDPDGGFFIWFDVAERDFDTKKFYKTASKNDVLFVPGYAFYPSSGYAVSDDCSQLLPQIQKNNGLRLCYSFSTEDEIKKGINYLGSLLTQALSKDELTTAERYYRRSLRKDQLDHGKYRSPWLIAV